MTAKSINNNNKNQKSYKSRPDANRRCHRLDETHYIYEEWIEGKKGLGFFKTITVEVGKDDGATTELFDYLQETDNAEVQDHEDDTRNFERLTKETPIIVRSWEDQVYSDTDIQSPLLKAYYKKVEPVLSEEEKDLIYDYFGLRLTQKEIATRMSMRRGGKPITREAVAKKLFRLMAKIKKIIEE